MKKTTILSFLLILFVTKSNAQELNFEWVKTLESTYQAYIASSTVDTEGNIINVGYYYTDIQLDPAMNRPVDTSISTVYRANAFVQKLDSNGNLLWAKTYGKNEEERFTSVATDLQNNIYITGYMHDFDDGNGNMYTTLSKNDSRHDIITLKMNSSGTIDWVHIMGGVVQDYGRDIAVDNDGNVYVLAEFKASITYKLGDKNGNQLSTGLSSNGGSDVAVYKFNSNGDMQWLTRLGGSSSYDTPTGMSIYGNKIYIQGWFLDAFEFEQNSTTQTLTTESGEQALFVAQLSVDGTINWAKHVGDGPGQIFETKATISYSNGVILSGTFFRGQIDFDPSTGFDILDADGTTGFLLSLDTNGNYQWAKVLNGRLVQSLAIIDSEIYVGQRDVTIYNLQGDSTSVIDLGTKPITTSIVGNSNSVYLTGYVPFATDFDPSTSGTAEIDPNGGQWGFVLKLTKPAANASIYKNVVTTAAIYPNPATNTISIKGINGNAQVSILNTLGAEVLRTSSTQNIDLSSLPAGLYTLITTQEDVISQAKFIKQ